MSADNLPLKKRLGLELYRQHRNNEKKLHTLNYLMWESTLRCNLSCKHCGSDCRKDMLQKDMPLPDFLHVIDTITPHVNTETTMIVITGGEPLLRNDLEKCGKELYKRRYPWGIVTNGLALTEKRLSALINSGMRSITISFDGLEESHNQMRGNPQSFKNALRAIEALAEYKNEIIYDVVTCVSSETYNELPLIKELLINKKVDRWRIFTVFPVGRASQYEELQLKPEQFKGLFDFIKETRKESKIKLSYGCEGFLGIYETEVRDSFFFCKAGVNVASVLIDGSISACPSIRANFTQGNIYKDNFMEVWNKRYEVFRNRNWAKQGICADCSFFRYCEGNGIHLHNEEGKLLFCHLKRIREGEEKNSK